MSILDDHLKVPDFEFLYMMLARLQSDCEYWLGWGKRCDKHLWALDPVEQIKEMRKVYAVLPEEPEWLTPAQLDEYEHKMLEAA